jgi:hypothetical protein
MPYIIPVDDIEEKILSRFHKNRKHKEDAVLKEAHNCYESKS